MPGAVEMLMRAAKKVDEQDTTSLAAAPTAAAAKEEPEPKKKPAAPVPWLTAFVAGQTLGNVFVTSIFAMTIGVCVGTVYGATAALIDAQSIVKKIVAALVALGSSSQLIFMWNALEPGSSGWKTFGLLVLASLQAAAAPALLYGTVFVLHLFFPTIGFHVHA